MRGLNGGRRLSKSEATGCATFVSCARGTRKSCHLRACLVTIFCCFQWHLLSSEEVGNEGRDIFSHSILIKELGEKVSLKVGAQGKKLLNFKVGTLVIRKSVSSKAISKLGSKLFGRLSEGEDLIFWKE